MHTLTVDEIQHGHSLVASNNSASDDNPDGPNYLLAIPGTVSGGSFSAARGYNKADPDTVLGAGSVGASGGGQPHENRQPYVAINQIICAESGSPDEPYLGIIKAYAGSTAPSGWAFCDGSLLPVVTNQALFSLLGTIYGGNGMTTFALPDLRARVALGAQTKDDSNLGEFGGLNSVALTPAMLGGHTHSLSISNQLGSIATPVEGAVLAAPWAEIGNPKVATAVLAYIPNAPTLFALNPKTIGAVGSGNIHNNMQPYLGLNYIICITGVVPPRS